MVFTVQRNALHNLLGTVFLVNIAYQSDKY